MTKTLVAGRTVIAAVKETNHRLSALGGLIKNQKMSTDTKTAQQQEQMVTNPSYARNYDTPYFRLLEKKGDDYELREYEETRWVKTDVRLNSMWENNSDTNSPFWKLFKYISGNNEASSKIPMTVPVRMEHNPKRVDMAFMVPHQVSSAPEPKAKEVELITSPRQLVYVKSFSGWGRGFFGNKNYFADNLELLKAFLDRDGKKYKSERFYTAQYNDPWTVFNRHNEVWIEAAE